MELYLNGQQIELSEDAEAVLLSFSSSSILNFGEVTGANSATFSIPPTATNIQILGPLNLPGFTKVTPYKKIDALVVSNSQTVFEGYAVIKNAGVNFEANLFGTNSNWIDRIKGVPLRSLDFGISIENTITDFYNYRNSNWEDGQLVPLANYGPMDFWIFPTLPFYFLRPAYYLKFVLQKIFEFAGVTPTGNFWTWPDLEKRILPISFPFVQADPAELLTVGYGVLNSPFVFDFYSDDTGEISWPVTMNSYGENFTYVDIDGFDSAQYNSTNTNVSIDASITLVIDEFVTALRFYALNGGERVLQKEVSGLVGPAEITINLNAENVPILANDPIYFYFEIVNAEATVTQIKKFNATVQNRNSVARGGEIRPEFNLPDLKIDEFLRDLAGRYGLVFSQSPANPGVLKIDFFEEVLNKPAAKDWSPFVNYAEAIPVEFRFGEYFRKNKFLSARAENEVLLYEKQLAGIYDGEFEVLDETLPDEGTIFESIFAPVLTRGAGWAPPLWDVNNWGTIQTLKATTNEDGSQTTIEEVETPPRLCVIQPADEFRVSSDAVGTSYVDISDGYLIETGEENLSFLSVDFFEKFRQTLDAAEVFTVPARLPFDEISNLDFTEPIYISNLGGKFFLNSIEEFDPSTGFCTLSILKIP